MFFKYYTAELMVFGSYTLKAPSITVKVWFWIDPLYVASMMRNQLELRGLKGHGVFNLRRVK